jgi:hypothetical protein
MVNSINIDHKNPVSTYKKLEAVQMVTIADTLTIWLLNNNHNNLTIRKDNLVITFNKVIVCMEITADFHILLQFQRIYLNKIYVNIIATHFARMEIAVKTFTCLLINIKILWLLCFKLNNNNGTKCNLRCKIN